MSGISTSRARAIALAWWQENRPQELAVMEDREAFFTGLGEQIVARTQGLADRLTGPGLQGEGYLDRVGQLNAAQSQAVEMALDELVFSWGPEADPIEESSPIAEAVVEASSLVREAYAGRSTQTA